MVTTDNIKLSDPMAKAVKPPTPPSDADLMTMKEVIPKIQQAADGQGLLVLEPYQAQALRRFMVYLQKHLPRNG